VCEFWLALLEPTGLTFSYSNRYEATPAHLQAREDLRSWRSSSQPKEIYSYAKEKLNAAGISVYSAMYNLTDWETDGEIDYAFEAAKTLGTNILRANCTVKSIKRGAPFADKHNVLLAAHSELAPFDTQINGMVFSNNLIDALKYSPNMRITLDTGHFTAYGGDALAFVREHHDKIVNLHLKDV